MRRICFFCDSDTTETIVSNMWELPGLDSAEIGFSVCRQCGLVFQSPTLSSAQMMKYYREVATYINPGRRGKPSLIKKRDLDRLLFLTQAIIRKIPRTVFQVGCSDGYTLSRFSDAGALLVEGIDPSSASHKLSRELYGIDTKVGSFEKFNPKRIYELIILTHVLEHLYNPIEAMQKCFHMQESGGWILIEVPLFERLDRWLPGLLTLEHLNYFSESTLLRLLYSTGYVPHLIEKLFNHAEYPVITIIARKEKLKPPEFVSDYSRSKHLLINYCKNERRRWGLTESKIKNLLTQGTSVYIWGAGIHTSQLFAFTDIKKYLKIEGLVDSSPTKWGKRIGSYMCHSPDEIPLKPRDTILISSYASEEEIYRGLQEHIASGVNVVRLYGGLVQ